MQTHDKLFKGEPKAGKTTRALRFRMLSYRNTKLMQQKPRGTVGINQA